jgi:hypothetical protein
MKAREKKFVCDLISLVANAVATDTISEAEDYLVEHYQGSDDELIEHSLNVMSQISNKRQQYESEELLG